MSTKILMRAGLAEADELTVASQYFDVIQDRVRACQDDLIIPRYSVLPYPEELERDIELLGARLINTTKQHHYVADLANWYDDFADVTPRTWMRASDVPLDEPGAFVLKGATNSRKDRWLDCMLASSREDIGRVLNNLLNDRLISSQGIYVRQYEQFERFSGLYGDLCGVNGLPVTNEWRCFMLDGELVARGFYWSEHYDLLAEQDSTERFRTDSKEAGNFVRTVIAPRLKNKIRFVVADVAKTFDGRWRLVELNDGTMSGISCIPAEDLYSNLRAHLEEGS